MDLLTALGTRPAYQADEWAVRSFDVIGYEYRRTLTAGDYAHHWNGQSYRPEKFAVWALEALQARITRARTAADGFINEVPEQAARLRDTLDTWAAAHVSFSLQVMASNSRLMSSVVTGGSNFPVRQQNKRRDQMTTKEARLEDHGRAILARLKRIAHPHGAPGEAIRSNNPHAVDLLREKLAEQERIHAKMVSINKIWRKVGRPGTADDDTTRANWAAFVEQCGANGIGEREALALMRGAVNHYMAPRLGAVQPVAAYELTNSNARMKQTRDRLAELERLAEQAAAGPTPARTVDTVAGAVEIIEDVDAYRVQMIFPGKPSADVRAILKGRGFRWAPSVGAWQRHLNDAGRAAVKYALADLEKLGGNA